MSVRVERRTVEDEENGGLGEASKPEDYEAHPKVNPIPVETGVFVSIDNTNDAEFVPIGRGDEGVRELLVACFTAGMANISKMQKEFPNTYTFTIHKSGTIITTSGEVGNESETLEINESGNGVGFAVHRSYFTIDDVAYDVILFNKQPHVQVTFPHIPTIGEAQVGSAGYWVLCDDGLLGDGPPIGEANVLVANDEGVVGRTVRKCIIL